MVIVDIFEIVDESLYSAVFEDNEEDSLSVVLDDLNNPEYLYEFFEKHEDDLKSGFFGSITIEQAVEITKDEIQKLEDDLIEIAELGKETEDNLQELIFETLHKSDTSLKYIETKAKGLLKKSWVRLYAIELAPNLYVITGGGIKLTETMNDREHLLKELDKLKAVKAFLKEHDIIDAGDIKNLNS
jgi:hypothetical protein